MMTQRKRLAPVPIDANICASFQKMAMINANATKVLHLTPKLPPLALTSMNAKRRPMEAAIKFASTDQEQCCVSAKEVTLLARMVKIA